MALKEEFEIIIDKDGKMQILAKGFQGKECAVPLKKVQEVLNVEAEISWTREYYETKETTGLETKVKDD